MTNKDFLEDKTVSLVLPAFNEETGLAKAIEEFKSTGLFDEIIVVNNNSTDRTAQIASKLATVVDEKNQGFGWAVRRGLEEAKSDLIVLAEPDGTFVGRDVIKMLAYAKDFDLVLGTRTTKELIWSEANMGWFLRIGNIIMAKLIEALFSGPSLSDCGCTMRLIHTDALKKISSKFTVGGSYFLPEMVILGLKNKLKIIEIPVNYRTRVGESKITGSTWRAFWVGIDMIKLALRYRFFGQ